MLQSPSPVDLIHHSSFADLFKQVKVSRCTRQRHWSAAPWMAISVCRVQQQLQFSQIRHPATACEHLEQVGIMTQVEDFSTYVGRLQTPRELMIMMVGRGNTGVWMHLGALHSC